MNKIFLILMFFSTCSNSENTGQDENSLTSSSSSSSEKTLIVYLSRTQNTKVVAELIQHKVGGELVALEKENPYPEDYQKIVDQVDR